MKKTIIFFLGLILLFALLLGIYKFNFTDSDIFIQGKSLAPKDYPMLYGKWVQPNPINDKEVQGFTLNKDGSAFSINMETLKYKSWNFSNGKLLLIAESIGNGSSSIDTTAYEVETISNTKLTLKLNEYREEYKKQ
jgi:hypothetical protein